MESTKGHTMALQNKLYANYKHDISELYELAVRHRFRPHFLENKKEGPIHNTTFTSQAKVDEFTGYGEGPTKIIAKTMAAQQVLVGLRTLPLPPRPPKSSVWKRKPPMNPRVLKPAPVFKPGRNPICCLSELVSSMRGKPPQYEVLDVSMSGPTEWSFLMQVSVADETAMGTGRTKKQAKKNAAARMLSVFGYNFPQEDLMVPHQPTRVTWESTPEETQESTPEETQQDTPDVTQEDTPDVIKEDTPDVIKEDRPDVIKEDTPDVIKEDTPDVTQEDTAEETQEDTPDVKENIPDVTQEDTPDLTVGDAPVDTKGDTGQMCEECEFPQNEPPSVDLQLLSVEVLPLLASMGVIENKDGRVQWVEQKPTNRCEALSKAITHEATRSAPETVICPETTESVTVPENTCQDDLRVSGGSRDFLLHVLWGCSTLKRRCFEFCGVIMALWSRIGPPWYKLMRTRPN